jgi:hypothetical protein
MPQLKRIKSMASLIENKFDQLLEKSLHENYNSLFKRVSLAYNTYW